MVNYALASIPFGENSYSAVSFSVMKMGFCSLRSIECCGLEGFLLGLHNLFTSMRRLWKNSGQVTTFLICLELVIMARSFVRENEEH